MDRQEKKDLIIQKLYDIGGKAAVNEFKEAVSYLGSESSDLIVELQKEGRIHKRRARNGSGRSDSYVLKDFDHVERMFPKIVSFLESSDKENTIHDIAEHFGWNLLNMANLIVIAFKNDVLTVSDVNPNQIIVKKEIKPPTAVINESETIINCFGCNQPLAYSDELKIHYCPNDCLKEMNAMKIPLVEPVDKPVFLSHDHEVFFDHMGGFVTAILELNHGNGLSIKDDVLNGFYPALEALQRINRFYAHNANLAQLMELNGVIEKLEKAVDNLKTARNRLDAPNNEIFEWICAVCKTGDYHLLESGEKVCDYCSNLMVAAISLESDPLFR